MTGNFVWVVCRTVYLEARRGCENTAKRTQSLTSAGEDHKAKASLQARPDANALKMGEQRGFGTLVVPYSVNDVY